MLVNHTVIVLNQGISSTALGVTEVTSYNNITKEENIYLSENNNTKSIKRTNQNQTGPTEHA
jgi:hypothetical protein